MRVKKIRPKEHLSQSIVLDNQAATILECGQKRVFSKSKSRQASRSTKNTRFLTNRICSFESILYIYQSEGSIFRPKSVQLLYFLNELKFFQVGAENER